jgi:small subunit ribosomal protein S16
MAVALKLYRMGKKGQPSYRIVAVNKRHKANGKYIEEIGFYNPMTEPATLNLKKDRLEYWQKVGAQISEGLRKLLKHNKLV